MNGDTKVSVVMITYGHRNYIEEAINGVYMQQTDFPVELIIADDLSPDQTDEVVGKMIDNAPKNITVKYTKHEANKGMISNFAWALKQATGKYIALCEGDDYWTDPLKLQKQVIILEENPDCVLCFAARDVLDNGLVTNTDFYYEEKIFDKSKIPQIYVPTLTAVFRNVVADIPSQINNYLIDASLFLFLSQFGSFYHLREKVAVYRTHDSGMWSGNSELTNYTRSVNVRQAAWKHFSNIDKLAVAKVLITWLRLKKNSERSHKRYFAALRTVCQEYYFTYYIWQRGLNSRNSSSRQTDTSR